MDNLSIPFHAFLNIQKSDLPEYLLMIGERPEYLNHVGTVHACVQVTLGEASTGQFLHAEMPYVMNGNYMPVVRSSKHKYHQPAHGKLYSKVRLLDAEMSEIEKNIEERGRAIFSMEIKIYDSLNKNTLTSVFDWFIGKV